MSPWHETELGNLTVVSFLTFAVAAVCVFGFFFDERNHGISCGSLVTDAGPRGEGGRVLLSNPVDRGGEGGRVLLPFFVFLWRDDSLCRVGGT